MIKCIKSDNIPADLHAFFTKKTANERRYSKTLDFSFSKHQSTADTLENRRLAAKSVGCSEHKLYFLNQVHSKRVITINESSSKLPESADGMVTNKQGLGLAILTADCAPILFLDPISKVIGAAHAGWRGALGGIVENTVDAMINIGATKKNISVAIGPSISVTNYEIGEEVKTKILSKNKLSDNCFFRKSTNKFLFDLNGFIKVKLKQHGVKNVSGLEVCTYKEKDIFHSYRRAKHSGHADHPRNISIIRL